MFNKFHAKASRKVLQFWSGGADSTYLLLQNLLAKNYVTCTYVAITNNRTKVKRETQARKALKEDLKIFCDYFGCPEPLFMEDHVVSIKGESFGRCPAPQQLIFAATSLLIGKGYDEIQMGVVVGDSMRGVPLNARLVEVYREVLSPNFPDITYPIEDVSKETIFLALKGYDELLGTRFLEHITVCEMLDEPCGAEKECHPCQTQQAVFKRLKWLEETKSPMPADPGDAGQEAPRQCSKNDENNILEGEN